MSLTIETSSDFKNIYVKSDSSSTNTDYPVMQVYLNSTLSYTLVVGGSTMIGSTTYTTTSGADNLDFQATVTTIGTEYIHTISTDSLGITSNNKQVLDDAVWEFKLLDATETENLFIGITVHDDIDCCIADKLDSLCDKNSTCSRDQVLKTTNNIYGMIYSSNISAKKGEFKNAECKFNIAANLCEDGCGCGCS